MAMAAAAVAVVALLLAPDLGRAQERRAEAHPHGLPYESPLALSPAAYEFFHPSERASRGHGGAAAATAPALAPRGQLRESAVRGGAGAGASSASVARADQEEGGVAPVRQVRRGGVSRARVFAGVVVGAAVVVAVALALAHVVARRRVAHGDAEAAGVSASASATKTKA